MSYPCQGWAVCIIATTLLPELPLRKFSRKSKDDCGRGVPAVL